jgi:hypothetical protein
MSAAAGSWSRPLAITTLQYTKPDGVTLTFRKIAIEPDGNCFYSAIARDQRGKEVLDTNNLKTDIEKINWLRVESADEVNRNILKKATEIFGNAYIESEIGHVEMEGTIEHQIHRINKCSVQTYCKNMKWDAKYKPVPIESWADDFILAFMPDVIHYPIHVFEKHEYVQNSLKLTSVWNGIGNKQKDKEPVCLLYTGGNHYTLLERVITKDEAMREQARREEEQAMREQARQEEEQAMREQARREEEQARREEEQARREAARKGKEEQAGQDQRGEQMRRAHGEVDSMFVRSNDQIQKDKQARLEAEQARREQARENLQQQRQNQKNHKKNMKEKVNKHFVDKRQDEKNLSAIGESGESREMEKMQEEEEQAGQDQSKREQEKQTAKGRDKQAKGHLLHSEDYQGQNGGLRHAQKINGRAAANESRGGEHVSSESINKKVKAAQKDETRRYHKLKGKDENVGSIEITHPVKHSQSDNEISEEEIQYTDEELEKLETFYENLRTVYNLFIGTIRYEFLKILANFLLTNDKDHNISTFADYTKNYGRCQEIIIKAIKHFHSAWLAEEITLLYGRKKLHYTRVRDLVNLITSKEYWDKDKNEIPFLDVLETNLRHNVKKWLLQEINSVQGDLNELLRKREEEKNSIRRNNMLENKEKHKNEMEARKENKDAIITGPSNWWKPCKDWWTYLYLYHPKSSNNISQENLNKIGENLFNRLKNVLAGKEDSCAVCSDILPDSYQMYQDDKVQDLENHKRNDSIVYDAFLQCFIKIWKASLQNLSNEMANKVRNIDLDTDSVFDQAFWHEVVWNGWDSWHLCKILFIQVLSRLAQSGLVQYGGDPLEHQNMSHRIYFQLYTPVRRDAYDHNRLNPADLTRLAIWYDGRLVSKGWCHKIRDLFGINQRRFVSAWVDALREDLVIRDNTDWTNRNFFDGVFQWRDVENYVKDANLTPEQLKIKRNRWKNESGKVVKTKNDYCFILPAECLREFTQKKPTPEIINDFCREFGYQLDGVELTEEQKENKKTFNRACQQFTLRMNVAFQELVKTYERHVVNWANPDKRLLNVDPLLRMRRNKDDLADTIIRGEYMKKFGVTEQKDSQGNTRTVTVQASTFATPYLVCLE